MPELIKPTNPEPKGDSPDSPGPVAGAGFQNVSIGPVSFDPANWTRGEVARFAVRSPGGAGGEGGLIVYISGGSWRI